jgi:methionyl-tRNA formyltransferase
MSSTPLRVIFMGTPQFAVPALQALLDGGHDVIAVYSQPPRPSGRGQKIQFSPVHTLAQQRGIPVYTPKSLKTEDAQKEFIALQADVAVVAAYGLLLPKAVLAAPRFGCLNIHASLLPRWRGASPIQHAIWKGDVETGVTIMQMDAGLDTGDMILKSEIPITQQTTAVQLQDALSVLGGGLIQNVLENIESITRTPQNNAASNYAPLLKKEDGLIDWQSSAVEIDRQIRALNPWPSTYTHTDIKGLRLKVLEAVVAEDMTLNAPVGRFIPDCKKGIVACGDGALKLLRVQPDGGKPMDFASFINGGYLTGDRGFS